MKTGPKPRTQEQIPNCDAPNCVRKATHWGHLCDTHYRRVLRKTAPLEQPIKPWGLDAPCSIVGCLRRAKVNGMCSAHDQRVRHGKPLVASIQEIKIPNKIELVEGISYIILTGKQGEEVGRTAVDAADIPALQVHRWRARKGGAKNAKAYAWSHTAGSMHGFLMKPPPDREVDHINRTPLDNRRANLRIVTHAINSQNVSVSNTKASGLPRGVSLRKTGMFQAYATLNKKMYHAGLYATVEEATSAAIALRLRLHTV